MTPGARAVVAWSSGKDSAWALHELRRAGAVPVSGLLTTVTDAYQRVSMHGVREALLDAQAAALGLPLVKVRIPAPCPDEVYAEKMVRAVAALRADGVTHFAFGDLFLEDVRDYRLAMLEGTGIDALFPLWGRDTAALAREMVAGGLAARIVCVDPGKLDAAFCGRAFDGALLDALPAGVDPCGENGEFHTVVTAGPMFAASIATRPGEVVEREGFVFADVIPEDGAPA